MQAISEGRSTFGEVKRGYDPVAVDGHLAAVQTRLHELENQLVEAREAEHAIQLTFQAATSAKQELLDAAAAEAAEIVAEARRDARRIREDAKTMRVEAEKQAERLITEARRDALQLLAGTRADAEELNARLLDEHAAVMNAVAEANAALESAEVQFDVAARSAAGKIAMLRATLAEEQSQLSASPPPDTVEPAVDLPAVTMPAIDFEEATPATESVVSIDAIENESDPDQVDQPPPDLDEYEDEEGGEVRQKDLLAALETLSALQL